MRYESGKELSSDQIKTLFLLLKYKGNCSEHMKDFNCKQCPFSEANEGHDQFGQTYKTKEYQEKKFERAKYLLSTM